MPSALPTLLALTYQAVFAASQTLPGAPAGFDTTLPYGGLSARTLNGNNEAQCYMDSSVGENPFVFGEFGHSLSLHASIIKAPNLCGVAYNSGIITTYSEFNQTYGYFEIDAMLPAGKGIWPAFWLLPIGGYTSELDVFEQVGVPNVVYSTTHGMRPDNTWGSDFQTVPLAFDSSQAFHRYGVDWEPTTTTFYVDGQPTVTAPTPVSMNLPMYMIVNLAVGGPYSWPGNPDLTTPLPANLRIRSLRAWATAGTINVNGSPYPTVQTKR